MGLREYQRKRNFRNTPEPNATRRKARRKSDLHFVIQRHDATRLHYDFRLETRDGVLKSWAVPKGLSLDPSVKRLAIMTEDHPGDYIDFEGKIPEGNYGAGSVTIWDTGKYVTEGDIEEQIGRGKVNVTLHGEKVRGSFALVRTGKDKQWLALKHTDEFSNAGIEPASAPSNQASQHSISAAGGEPRGTGQSFPTAIKPMLAVPVEDSFDKQDWVYEIKWDGVRAISFFNKSDGVFRIQSRRGNDVSHRYPEMVSAIATQINCNNSAVLDGEIVILDERGKPDFQRHQQRMNLEDLRQISRLASKYPATFYVFDILYLDGLNLEQLDLVQRRKILTNVLPHGQSTDRIRISEFIEGKGTQIFRSAVAMGLEGIIAKHTFSKYEQGIRSPAWLKIKGVLTQDCVVIGYTRGEGNRQGYFGSLILAIYDKGKLRFVGHSGSGFDYAQLGQMMGMMQRLKVDRRPIETIPYVNREPVWLQPQLVVEVKFQGWTTDGIMRAPIFVRLRYDKRPEDCIAEVPRATKDMVSRVTLAAEIKSDKVDHSFSNLDKVFWPASPQTDNRQITKQDLIEYYDGVSEHLLPHLRDRPLSLSRYPDGIKGKSFYHKNWHQTRPDYVKTIKVYSESSQRVINYIMCNNLSSLLWLANLGCIEIHPWYSRVHDYSACNRVASRSEEKGESILEESNCGLNLPDYVVFDLDPFIYSGSEAADGDPEYNVKGFKAAVEVALMLKDLLDGLRIKSYVKTSGKTGLHVFVPVTPDYTYDQTRAFAEVIGRILIRQGMKKITMDWQVRKRKGKVFFDYNQNSMGKTLASLYSARPTASATVSMPVDWQKLEQVLPTDFTIHSVPKLLKKTGDPWQMILKKQQDLAMLLRHVNEIGPG